MLSCRAASTPPGPSQMGDAMHSMPNLKGVNIVAFGRLTAEALGGGAGDRSDGTLGLFGRESLRLIPRARTEAGNDVQERIDV